MVNQTLNSDTFIIIPVYNESKVIGGVISDVKKSFSNIICVDDGSKDNSGDEIRKAGATLVEHPMNMGQGAAIQTGIEYAVQFPEARYFVTFDADGQHSIDDVKTMLDQLQETEVDIVLGSRFLGDTKNISKVKKAILKAAVQFTNHTTGLKLTDAHNGLRVFNRHVAENLKITMPDMAHASEIIHRIAEEGFKYKEMPVTITYTDYSKAKGQSLMNAVNITFDLMLQRFSKK